MIKKLADILTALSQFLKQVHLTASDKSYAAHLLTEKIQEEVDEDIDRIKELFIASTGEGSIANAQESLEKAEQTLRAFLQNKSTETTTDALEVAAELCVQTYDAAAEVSDYYSNELKSERFAAGIVNAADDICERRARNYYLLMTEVPWK